MVRYVSENGYKLVDVRVETRGTTDKNEKCDAWLAVKRKVRRLVVVKKEKKGGIRLVGELVDIGVFASS
jgi:hypothetical protein